MNRIKDWALYIVHSRLKGQEEWKVTRHIFDSPEEAVKICVALDEYFKDTDFAVFEFILNDSDDWRQYDWGNE